MELKSLQQFYLAGGTALALQLGHRSSVDIDLFTSTDFNQTELDVILNDQFPSQFQKTGSNSVMYFCFLNDVKVDFINNRVPLQFPIVASDGIRLATVKDIAPLKMKAIFQRGSKKDFIDFYVLLQHFTLEELLLLFYQQFPTIDAGQLLLSLNYFDDAENDVMPKLYFDESWAEIKSFINRIVLDYLKH
jgi:predicted nucleotidyltransferase component of viral defense system